MTTTHHIALRGTILALLAGSSAAFTNPTNSLAIVRLKKSCSSISSFNNDYNNNNYDDNNYNNNYNDGMNNDMYGNNGMGNNDNMMNNNNNYNNNDMSGGGNNNNNNGGPSILSELQELTTCTSLLYTYLTKPNEQVSAQDVVLACDAVDECANTFFDGWDLFLNEKMGLRKKCHEFGRYQLLVKMLQTDYEAYVATASFLGSRIPRRELPNVQDVPYPESYPQQQMMYAENGQPLVPDCELQPLQYNDSALDKLLLFIFRKLVTKNTGGVQNDIPGIQGLVEQAKSFMLQPYQTAEAQHYMVKETLAGLMTPVLPPFYRIFMSGIVPNVGTPYDGKQIGPWFYAPFLTSIVTPTFFGFLVGPSYPNRRMDGQRGGLVVEKCKFLQESGCKGLCLHQCKIPAEEFFRENLGLDLTVRPNFETQECQWSFGETPLPADQDPSCPRGCLVGCESRQAMAGQRTDALCL